MLFDYMQQLQVVNKLRCVALPTVIGGTCRSMGCQSPPILPQIGPAARTSGMYPVAARLQPFTQLLRLPNARFNVINTSPRSAIIPWEQISLPASQNLTCIAQNPKLQ